MHTALNTSPSTMVRLVPACTLIHVCRPTCADVSFWFYMCMRIARMPMCTPITALTVQCTHQGSRRRRAGSIRCWETEGPKTFVSEHGRSTCAFTSRDTQRDKMPGWWVSVSAWHLVCLPLPTSASVCAGGCQSLTDTHLRTHI